VESLFDAIPEISLSDELMRRASNLAWKLDRKGSVLPLSDIVIAQCALDSGSWLVSEDKHFAKISGLKVRKALPRVER
jgi:predicted nucleic acid-binding protein